MIPPNGWTTILFHLRWEENNPPDQGPGGPGDEAPVKPDEGVVSTDEKSFPRHFPRLCRGKRRLRSPESGQHLENPGGIPTFCFVRKWRESYRVPGSTRRNPASSNGGGNP